MPIYSFFCTKCATSFKKLYTVEAFEKKKNSTQCTKCTYIAGHLPGAATSQTMEVLDNGIMPQRLERYSEAERIFKERELAWDKKYGEKKEDE